MPVRSKKDPNWPSWYYSPDGVGEIFERMQDVPFGWVRVKPQEFTPTEPVVVDEDAVRQKLKELGVDINPTWGKAKLQEVLNDRSTSR